MRRLLLVGFFLLVGLAIVSAECVTDGDCPFDAACVTNDYNGRLGECIVCTDSDGGSDLYRKGAVEGVWLINPHTFEQEEDSCSNSDVSQIQEYGCEVSVDNPEGTTGYTYAYYRTYSCPTGYSCSNGACVSTNIRKGRVLVECSDRVDNDGDSFVDMKDPDCTSARDATESSLMAATIGPFNYEAPEEEAGFFTKLWRWVVYLDWE